ncbi:MAG: putative molybdenum carrier protein [Hyphomicrobiales bacterium]
MDHKIKIISGGQSGVDRAALAFALHYNMPCGGYCPKGRLAEDGPINNRFPLVETPLPSYPQRTEMNVKESDATLIIYHEEMDKGTKFTKELAEKLKKPILELSFNKPIHTKEFRKWLKNNSIKTLNIAGPRESRSPGIYSKVWDSLHELFLD